MGSLQGGFVRRIQRSYGTLHLVCQVSKLLHKLMFVCFFSFTSVHLPVPRFVPCYNIHSVRGVLTNQDATALSTAHPTLTAPFAIPAEPWMWIQRWASAFASWLSCRPARAAASHLHFHIFIHLADGLARSGLKCVRQRNNKKVCQTCKKEKKEKK